MGIFGQRRDYDRARILDAAARARAKRQRKKAIALYRWVLAVERHNPDLHAKLAPLLAETGQHFDAWGSFRAAAQAALREGNAERALSLYRDAARYLPQEDKAWQSIAQLEEKAGHERQAVETLLEGSRHFRARFLRPQAIHLLRHARRIEPWDFVVVLDLVRLLAKTDQLEEARGLLQGLASRACGDRLRRVRAVQFGIDPSPRTAFSWLHALVRPAPEPPAPRGPSEVLPLRARARG